MVCSAAVSGSEVADESVVAVEDEELPVPTGLSVALVEIGTGTAVVPSVPVDVLKL